MPPALVALVACDLSKRVRCAIKIRSRLRIFEDSGRWQPFPDQSDSGGRRWMLRHNMEIWLWHRRAPAALLKDHWNHWDCEVKMHEGAVLTEVSPIIHGGGWAQLASSDAWTSERIRNFSPSVKLPSRSIPIPLLAIMIITIIITILTIDADTQRASSERLSNRKTPKQESFA